MKTTDVKLTNELETAHNLNARPKVIVEWNWNRYVETTCNNDNTPEEDNPLHPDMFPIKSIVDNYRGGKDMAKLLLNEGTVFDPDYPNFVRYYLPSTNDKYTYWVSQEPTGPTGVFPTVGGVTNVQPYVTYSEAVNTNKIHIAVQNNWASPSAHKVYVKTTELGAWTLIATNPTISNEGFIDLYWNGSWNTTPTVEGGTDIWGIKYTVDSMGPGKTSTGATTRYTTPQQGIGTTTGYNSSLHLIEISARKIRDISDRVITTAMSKQLSEDSELTPLGKLTSDTLDISLENYDNLFDKDNTESEYSGMLYRGAKVTLSYIYAIQDYPADSEVEVPECVMYSNDWIPQEDKTVHLECRDDSEYLQTTECPEMMYTDMTLPQIVCRILDGVGFTNHSLNMTDPGMIIPIWYTDGTKSVWEVLSDLAEVTQTAMYFDAAGKFIILTRDKVFAQTDIDYTLLGEEYDGSLPNIVDQGLTEGDRVGSNHITVNYSKTEFGTADYERAVSENLWTPDGSVVLRAAPLRKTLLVDDTYVVTTAAAAKSWPFESMMYIENELIKTYGKLYNYRDASGVQHTKTVRSIEEQKELDNLAPVTYRGLNAYTGHLTIGVKDGTYDDARGVENSQLRTHSILPSGRYDVRQNAVGSTATTASYWTHLKDLSRMELNTNYYNVFSCKAATVFDDSVPIESGTRLTFIRDSSKLVQEAGITINHTQSTGTGYYICLKAAARTPEEIKQGVQRLQVYRRNSGDVKTLLGQAEITVPYDTPIDLDVKFTGNSTSNQYIRVWINGVLKYKKAVPSSIALPRGGSFGLFANGTTNVQFEYLYGQSAPRTTSPQMLDSFTEFDQLESGVSASSFLRTYVQKRLQGYKIVKGRSVKARTYDNTVHFFDEFGPYLHEVRDYDVKFDPAPVQYSNIYSSNTKEASVLTYSASPFSAKFRIMNTARKNAIVSATSDGTDQVLTILGRSLTVAESSKVEGKNDLAIKRDGEVKLDFDSSWIQNEDAGTDLIEWMKAHWSSGVETLDVDIFGNPLLELGDLVGIQYTDKGYNLNDHQFFVLGITNNFDAGLQTTLHLRRKVN